MHVRSSQMWGRQQGYISKDEAGLPPALHTGRSVQAMMGFVTGICLGVRSPSASCHPSASSLQKVTTGLLLEVMQGLLLGTQIFLRSHLPGFPPSLKHEADVNGLHQEDAISEDLLVTPLMGSSPGSSSSSCQAKGTKSGQRGDPWATWGFDAPWFWVPAGQEKPFSPQRQQNP